jgi:hypothetical protein
MKLIALALILTSTASAWNPFDKSKSAWVVSVVVSVAAQSADYGTTKRAIRAGNAAEGNPLLTTTWRSGGPLCTPRLIGFKVSMAAATIYEVWKLHRAEKQYKVARDQAAKMVTSVRLCLGRVRRPGGNVRRGQRDMGERLARRILHEAGDARGDHLRIHARATKHGPG